MNFSDEITAEFVICLPESTIALANRWEKCVCVCVVWGTVCQPSRWEVCVCVCVCVCMCVCVCVCVCVWCGGQFVHESPTRVQMGWVEYCLVTAAGTLQGDCN